MHRIVRGSLTAIAVFVTSAAPAPPQTTSSPDSPQPAARLVEPARLLVSPGRLKRTVELPAGSPVAGESLRWELNIGERQVAAGRVTPTSPAAGGETMVISTPLPGIAAPVGMDLVIETSTSGTRPSRSVFPFTLYPEEPGEAIIARFNRSKVALFDPEDRLEGIFESLGFPVRSIREYEALLDAEADLIVIGTGGFTRRHEALGPILAQRARDGTPLLMLDQPSLPSTLTDRLRLWPSFGHGIETEHLLASGHPALRSPSGTRGAEYLLSEEARMSRPYLPPTRGNFRVLAGVRVKRGSTWLEGVGIVELFVGGASVVAAQLPIASDYFSEPGARVLLINLLAYLLDDHRPLRQAFLYGSREGLPSCLAGLAPVAPSAPIDLRGVDLLIVPANWRAPRRRQPAAAAPLAEVARFLHDGGTILLVDPQPLVADYLSALIGEGVEFEPFDDSGRGAGSSGVDGSPPLLEGIGPEDLGLLGRRGEPEFRLHSHRPGERFESILRAPGLSLYRVGRGSLVALAMPRSVGCGSPRAASLLARLLTNLGVPLEEGGGSPSGVISRVGG